MAGCKRMIVRYRQGNIEKTGLIKVLGCLIKNTNYLRPINV